MKWVVIFSKWKALKEVSPDHVISKRCVLKDIRVHNTSSRPAGACSTCSYHSAENEQPKVHSEMLSEK